MFKKIITVLALITTATQVYASPINCSSLIGTSWHDNNENHFGKIDLDFTYQSGDPSSNNNFIHYTLEYNSKKFGDHTTSGELQSIHCNSQPGSPTQLTLGFDDGVTTLVLQSTDDKSFMVQPGSQLSDNSSHAVAMKGSFLRN